jgi:hypothetical protein
MKVVKLATKPTVKYPYCNCTARFKKDLKYGKCSYYKCMKPINPKELAEYETFDASNDRGLP